MRKLTRWALALICCIVFINTVQAGPVIHKLPLPFSSNMVSGGMVLDSGLALWLPLTGHIEDLVTTTDGTFVRDSEATYTDNDGVVITVGDHVPRYELVDGELLLLLEPLHKNLCIESADFNEWTTSNVSIAADVTGPDGVVNSATTITDDDASDEDSIRISINPETDNKKYAYTVYVKEGTSADFTLRFRDNFASATRAEIDFKWDGADLIVENEDVGKGAVKQSGTSDWWRAIVYVPAGTIVEANVHTLYLYPTEKGRQAAETTIFWGVDFIEHAVEMSTIPTAGSAVTVEGEGGHPYYGLPTDVFVEDLGGELVTKGDFPADDIALAGAKNITGITKADPGVMTLAGGHGFVDGQVVFIEGVANENGVVNDLYWKLRNFVADTCEFSNQAIGTWDTDSLDTTGFTLAGVGGTAKVVDFTSWIEGDGWHPGVDGAGSLTNTTDCDGEQLGNTNLVQHGILSVNDTIKTTITVSNYTDGATRFNIGGSSGGVSHTENGSFTEYYRVPSGSALYVEGRDGFIGSIDNVSVEEVTNARNGKPPESTTVVLVRFGYAYDDIPIATGSGIVGSQDLLTSLIYNQITAGGGARIATRDGSNIAGKNIDWSAHTTYKVAAQTYISSNVYFMRVGIEPIGSEFDAASWGPPVEFDGAYDVGGNFFQLAYDLFGPMWIGKVQVFNRKLLDSEIHAR